MAHRVVYTAQNIRHVLYTTPYDSEVEYLETIGTQWINTWVLLQEGLIVTCDFQLVYLGVRNYKIFETTMLHNEDDTPLYKSLFYFGAIRRNSQPYWTSYTLSTSQTDVIADTNRHIVVLDTVQNKTFFDGSLLVNNNKGIIPSYDNPILLCKTSRCRIFSFKIHFNGTLVRDFIPVRVGNIGYMYDKVSGKLFENKGTGNFILGNDVANPVPNIRRVFRFGNKRFVTINND